MSRTMTVDWNLVREIQPLEAAVTKLADLGGLPKQHDPLQDARTPPATVSR